MNQALLEHVADQVGTPVYVYDAAGIRARYERLAAALASRIPFRIHYSVKANGNLAVLGLLRTLGAGADIVSGGELARALAAGFAPPDIVFSGVGKTASELEAAVEAGVGSINVESAGEVETLASVARARGRTVPIGIRVNPDVTAETHPYTQTGGAARKFGVPLDEARALAERCVADAHLELRAVGMHIGSQVCDPGPYAAGARRLVELVCALRAGGVASLTSIDVGGGFAVRVGPGGRDFPIEALGETVASVIAPTGLTLRLEPGRFLVAAAGVLLTRVLYRKRMGGRALAIVDAGMTDLIRPSLYQAVHDVTVVGNGGHSTVPAMDIVGPVCESGDFLARDRALVGAAPGALLAVHGVGAYGFAMSSNYNSRPRPPEVLVDGSRWALIRERERTADLMRGETLVPAWR